MKISTLFLFCLSGFALFPFSTSLCQNDSEPEIIKININEKNREKLNFEIVDVIPLETSEDCMIGYASKIRFYKNRIYVINNNRFKQPALFVFDQNGKFLKKTIQGKGPGEVIEPFTFAINEEESEIYMYDQAMGRTLIYDLELNYIRTLKHKYIMAMDYYHLGKDTMLVFKHWKNRDYTKGNQYFECHLYTEGLMKSMVLDIPLYGEKYAQSGNNSVWKSNDEVLFLAPWNYNVYALEGDKATIRYKLDFGKQSFSQKELDMLSSDELRERITQGKCISTPSGIFRTRDFFVFSSRFKGNPISFFRSEMDNTIYLLNDCLDTKLVPMFRIKGVTSEGLFYSKAEPDQLIEGQHMHKKLKGLRVSEIDNPYILLFKVSEPK